MRKTANKVNVENPRSVEAPANIKVFFLFSTINEHETEIKN